MAIKKFNIPHHSEDWYRFRMGGIGSSESGIVLKMNKYTPKVKLYYEKIGLLPLSKRDNEAMFHGRLLEEYILNLWQYWDGEEYNYERDMNLPPEERSGYIERFKAGNKFRTMTPNSMYAINDTYPWLFDTVDAMADAGQFRFDTGELSEKPFALEAKTIAERVAKEWKLNVPIGYLVQATHHMIVHDLDYSEIILLQDGRYLDVIPVPMSDRLAALILRETKIFWDTILHVREAVKEKIKAERAGDVEATERAETIIQRYEPEAETGDAYKEFKVNQYKDTDLLVVGDLSDYSEAINYKSMSFLIKEAAARQSLAQNRLLKKMIDNDVRKIELPGGNGYIQLTTRSGSDKPFVDIRPKLQADEKEIATFLDAAHFKFTRKKEGPKPKG